MAVLLLLKIPTLNKQLPKSNEAMKMRLKPWSRKLLVIFFFTMAAISPTFNLGAHCHLHNGC